MGKVVLERDLSAGEGANVEGALDLSGSPP
jgi:hypothetical protein